MSQLSPFKSSLVKTCPSRLLGKHKNDKTTPLAPACQRSWWSTGKCGIAPPRVGGTPAFTSAKQKGSRTNEKATDHPTRSKQTYQKKSCSNTPKKAFEPRKPSGTYQDLPGLPRCFSYPSNTHLKLMLRVVPRKERLPLQHLTRRAQAVGHVYFLFKNSWLPQKQPQTDPCKVPYKIYKINM